MSKTLVVVESPAKAKTIKKYLGSKYEVMASKGHVKDLPKKMGIDIEHGFEETYEVIVGKEKVLAELKDAAADADQILLATDPDREGEAIAWHLSEELGGKNKKRKTKRVEFHEITKKGVQHGVDHPRELNKDLYDAQRARRVLDRIVGYDVSALVWSKLAFGLSAGRVQSVALRLIVDREREIEAFQPVEYWNCGAWLQPADGTRGSFYARLSNRDGKKVAISNETEANELRGHLEKAAFTVAKITKSERKRNAPPPYTTSKLQQDAVNRLGFSAKRTMQVAQGLYEGVDLGKDAGGQVGLITYMRTDSVRTSPEAVAAVREYVAEKYGKDHLPAEPNTYKSKKSAQEAHEAIRPTSLDFPPDSIRRHLKDEQYKLYKMIWDRFAASQMKEALYDQTGVDIEAKPRGADGTTPTYGLRAGGRVLKFAGWLAAYESAATSGKVELAGESEGASEANAATGENPAAAGPNGAAHDTSAAGGDSEEGSIVELSEGEALKLAPDLKTDEGVRKPVVTEQKFTQPPPRYNEGSLVRELEDRGIGRPSTYAEIIGKVQARDYVEKLEGRFHPTTLGKYVVDGLVKSELDFMDPAFTSGMEEELDEVEAGNKGRLDLLSRFYKKFRSQLDKSKKGKRWNPEPEPTGEICAVCGKNGTSEDKKLKALPPGEMMKRWSKNGWFLGCSNYPKCKNTRDMGPDGKGAPPPRETGINCDKCGKPMTIRTGRYGEFLSCSGYPECKNAKPVPLGVPCPKCGGDLIEVKSKKRGGRSFFGCSNWNVEGIKCDFKLWQKPINEPCPVCKAPFLVHAGNKNKPLIGCANKECGYKRAVEETPAGEAGSVGSATTAAAHHSAPPPVP